MAAHLAGNIPTCVYVRPRASLARPHAESGLPRPSSARIGAWGRAHGHGRQVGLGQRSRPCGPRLAVAPPGVVARHVACLSCSQLGRVARCWPQAAPPSRSAPLGVGVGAREVQGGCNVSEHDLMPFYRPPRPHRSASSMLWCRWQASAHSPHVGPAPSLIVP